MSQTPSINLANILDDIFGSYKLDARAASEFSPERAKSKLLSLDITADRMSNFTMTTAGNNMVGDTPDEMGRLMRLAGWVDLGSELTVRLPSIPVCSKLITPSLDVLALLWNT